MAMTNRCLDMRCIGIAIVVRFLRSASYCPNPDLSRGMRLFWMLCELYQIPSEVTLRVYPELAGDQEERRKEATIFSENRRQGRDSVKQRRNSPT